jgi:hypothetical protein
MRLHRMHPGALLDAIDMCQPVQCGRCGRIYDLGKVEVLHRYLDCTLFRSPCCKQQVDTRCEDAPGWTSQVDYIRIDKSLIEDSFYMSRGAY